MSNVEAPPAETGDATGATEEPKQWGGPPPLGGAAHPGKRGFRTCAPPPEGLVGWNEAGERLGQEQEAERNEAAQEERQPVEADEFHSRYVVAVRGLFDRQKAELGPDWGERTLHLQDRIEDQEKIGDDALPRNPVLHGKDHLEAVVNKHIDVLQETDCFLRDSLVADAGVLEHEGQAKSALALYCATLSAFDAGPEVERAAFKAVLADDVQALRGMLEGGRLPKGLKNPGGQSLLEVARERRKPAAEELLVAWEQEEQQREQRARAAREAAAREAADQAEAKKAAEEAEAAEAAAAESAEPAAGTAAGGPELPE